MKKLLKIATLTAVLGLIIIFAVILSGISAPNIYFNIGVTLGVGLCFISALLFIIYWGWSLKDALANKHYIAALLLVLLALSIITRYILR